VASEVIFDVPGKLSVRMDLCRREGDAAYNYATGKFYSGESQTSPIVRRNSTGKFHFDVAWLGPDRLPTGEYRLQCAGTKVYFNLEWAGATPIVTITGAPVDLTKLGVPAGGYDGTAIPGQLTAAAFQDGIKAFDQVTIKASETVAFKPEAKPEPKPAGPTLEHDGKTLTVTEWGMELGLSPTTIYERLAQGCTIEQALAVPTHTPDNRLPGGRAGRAVELD
jgi:hypothetical protein